jgi:anti-sigma factor ChrR (cupin superfamily)
MSSRLEENLVEYVLGTLPDAERLELEAALAESAVLRLELAAVRETLGRTADSVAPVKPAGGGRARLLAALDSGARYAPFLHDLARHFDLAVTRVRELFDQIDDPARWEAGPLPGISVMHFAGGPNAVAPDTGFVRLARGLHFPYHRHLGHEINYVMEGAVRNGDGRLFLPGEAIEMGQGTAHEFSIPDDADALIAVIQAGFDIVPKP